MRLLAEWGEERDPELRKLKLVSDLLLTGDSA